MTDRPLTMLLAESGKSQGSGDSVPGRRPPPYSEVRKNRMSQQSQFAEGAVPQPA